MKIANRWFETRRVDDRITLLWEPHVTRLEQCNMWHVRGRDADLLVDAGMGITKCLIYFENICSPSKAFAK